MKIVNVEQGTPEWHEFRKAHLPASLAPEMMGEGYETRRKLLREWGQPKEVNDFQQRIFDRGHELEKAALEYACELACEDLYPVSGVISHGDLPDGLSSDVIELLDGRLSASFDGIDMEHSLVWEHKTWKPAIQLALDDGEIPLQYRIQMEQQLLVSGAEKVLFMASDETHECHAYYESDPELRLRLCNAWAEFVRDLDSEPETRIAVDDPEWINIESHIKQAQAQIQSAEIMLDHWRHRAIAYADGDNVKGANIELVAITRKGSISYAKAFKELLPEADLESFRGEPVTSIQLREVKG